MLFSSQRLRIFKLLAKALIRLHISTGWSEPLLVTYTTHTYLIVGNLMSRLKSSLQSLVQIIGFLNFSQTCFKAEARIWQVYVCLRFDFDDHKWECTNMLYHRRNLWETYIYAFSPLQQSDIGLLCLPFFHNILDCSSNSNGLVQV